MRAEGRAGEGRREGRRGEEEAGGSRAALTTRAPRLRRDGAGRSPPAGAASATGGRAGPLGERRGHRALRGGRGGERAAPPPRGRRGRGSLRVAARRRLYLFPPRSPNPPPARGSPWAGPGHWPGWRRDGGPGTAGVCQGRPARASRRDSLRICVEISSLPFFLFRGARLHFFL